MKLIVSCNDHEGGLFIVDTKTKEVKRQDDEIRTGICSIGNRIFSMAQDGFVSEYEYEKSGLKFVRKSDCFFKDAAPHDLKHCGSKYLYVVVTEWNSICKIRISDFKTSRHFTFNDHKSDVCHINSLYMVRPDFFYASMFCDGSEGKRWNYRDGVIVRYCDGERSRISSFPIAQPHSIVGRSEKILGFCSSYDMAVCYVSRPIFSIDGYARGLLFEGDRIYVGQSTMQNHPRTDLKFECDCGIVVVNKNNYEDRDFIPIPALSVYDVIKVKNA